MSDAGEGAAATHDATDPPIAPEPPPAKDEVAAPAVTPLESHLAELVNDAEYVAGELLRGEVVSGNALAKVMPSVIRMTAAANLCRRLGAKATETPAPTAPAPAPLPVPAPAPVPAPDPAAAPVPAPVPVVPPVTPAVTALISAAEQLETAMSEVMVAIAPITVESLRDTQISGMRGNAAEARVRPHLLRIFPFLREAASPSDRFSDQLLYFTLFILLLAFIATLLSPPALPSRTEAPASPGQAKSIAGTKEKPPPKTPPSETPHAGGGAGQVPPAGGTPPAPAGGSNASGGHQ